MKRWTIDPIHSQVNFKVKHLVISTVSGHFDTFTATIDAAKEDFSDATIAFEADVHSINTKNEQRDNHLRSADFFDAAAHPKMTFVSTSVKRLSDFELLITGDLTMRGITKQVTLDAVYNGTVPGFGGNLVAGFEIVGKLNRFDYGLQWSALTETGGMVVSNEVKLEILAEFNAAQAQAKAA